MQNDSADVLEPEGPWLDQLDAAFLAQRLGRDFASLAVAQAAFATEGAPALLPLAAGLEFDPDYYRETNPGFAAATDLHCYIDWLNEGIALGRHPSPAANLAALRLDLTRYPEGFAWAYYARLHPATASHRWAVLEHFCDQGFAEYGETFPFSAADFSFLRALGILFSVNDDMLAIRAYELARSFAPLVPGDLQHLADAYLRAGFARPAKALYAELIEDGTAQDWTLRNFIQVAVRLGQWAELEAGLARAAPDFHATPYWPEILHGAMQALEAAQTALAAARLAAGLADEATAIMTRLHERLGRWAGLLAVAPGGKGGTVFLVADMADPGRAARRVAAKQKLLAAAATPSRVFALAAARDALAALPDAGALILFRAPANAGIVLLAIAAHRRGIPILYEDETAPGAVPVYAHYRGLLPAAEHEALCLASWSRAAAATLADAALAPTPELAAAWAAHTAKSRGFCLPDPLPPQTGAPAGDRATVVLRARELLFLDAAAAAGGALLALLAQRPALHLALLGPIHLDAAFDAHAARISDAADMPDDAALVLLFPGTASEAAHEAGLAWAEAAARAVPVALLAPDDMLPDLRHGETLLRAADPAAWRAAAAQALDDAGRCVELGLAARELAAALHGEAATRAALSAALAGAE